MVVHHRLLHRVQPFLRQILDGDQLPAVQRRQQLDASVEGAVADAIAIEIADHDRAGPAIAFRATLLGAGAALRTQPVEDRQLRIEIGGLDQPLAQQESDRAGHQLPR